MKKKNNLEIFVLTLVMFATIIPVAVAMNENIKYIEQTQQTGNTLYVGGNGPGNYSSIQSAIDNATDGYTIYVYDDSSPYYETIDISKSIKLVGENKETTIIDGERQDKVIFIGRNTENVKITGFTIRNSSLNGISSGVILYFNPTYINISDNIIINNKYGILFFAAYHSSPVNRSTGITSLYDCVVSNNKISNNYVGVELDYAYNNVIFNNTISDNSYCGFYLYNSGSNSFYLNNMINNSNNVLVNYLPWYKSVNLWYNPLSKKGNYWDDYEGSDNLPPYGIGDTPYIIPPYLYRNNDNYPLMKPYNGSFASIQSNQQSQFNQQIQNDPQQLQSTAYMETIQNSQTNN